MSCSGLYDDLMSYHDGRGKFITCWKFLKLSKNIIGHRRFLKKREREREREGRVDARIFRTYGGKQIGSHWPRFRDRDGRCSRVSCRVRSSWNYARSGATPSSSSTIVEQHGKTRKIFSFSLPLSHILPFFLALSLSLMLPHWMPPWGVYFFSLSYLIVIGALMPSSSSSSPSSSTSQLFKNQSFKLRLCCRKTKKTTKT